MGVSVGYIKERGLFIGWVEKENGTNETRTKCQATAEGERMWGGREAAVDTLKTYISRRKAKRKKADFQADFADFVGQGMANGF